MLLTSVIVPTQYLVWIDADAVVIDDQIRLEGEQACFQFVKRHRKTVIHSKISCNLSLQ